MIFLLSIFFLKKILFFFSIYTAKSGISRDRFSRFGEQRQKSPDFPRRGAKNRDFSVMFGYTEQLRVQFSLSSAFPAIPAPFSLAFSE